MIPLKNNVNVNKKRLKEKFILPRRVGRKENGLNRASNQNNDERDDKLITANNQE